MEIVVVLREVRGGPYLRSCPTTIIIACVRLRLFAAAPKNQVVISARREDKLQEVADEIKAVGGETAIVAGDVSKVGTLPITRKH